MHVYSCAECGNQFETPVFASHCPECRCKVLIHLEGERRRVAACSCSSGSCAGCSAGCAR